METREISIIEGAFRIFSRYGVQRTRMSDIARETGISRQTLYNAFSNKDDVLRATIRLFNERAIAAIEEGVKSAAGLGPQLDVVFEQIAFRPFVFIQSSPNAEDIVQGMNATSRAEIEQGNEQFRKSIEKILKPVERELNQSGISARDLSNLIQKSASAAKHQAKDQAELQRLLDNLKRLVLRAASQT